MSTVLRNNTWIVDNASSAYRDGGNFGNGSRIHQYSITTEGDIVDGTVHTGSGWGSANFSGSFTASFVGPTSGTADAGGGEGSGFEVSGGAARNGVNTLFTATDSQGFDRVLPTDAGAIDADAVPPSFVNYLTTFPVDGSTDVATPATVAGSTDASASIFEYRVFDEAANLVWDGTAFVADNDSELGWLTASHDATAETWTADAATTLPQGGQTIKVSARRI